MPQLEPILQPLAQSPHLTRSVQQIHENVKAEFINGAVDGAVSSAHTGQQRHDQQSGDNWFQHPDYGNL